jgi:hypothetical protein
MRLSQILGKQKQILIAEVACSSQTLRCADLIWRAFEVKKNMAKKPETKPKEAPKPQEKSGEKTGAKKGGGKK